MKSSFQTAIIIVCGLAFVVAIAVFSGLFSGGGSNSSGEPEGLVLVWGSLPAEGMSAFVDSFNGQGLGYSILYVEHPPETFAADLTSALADNVAPDVVLVPSEIYSQFKDKLYPIPYEAYNERAFRDTYVDGAQLFLEPNGLIGVPLLVDPLVVYYNKDKLASANFALPPRTWTEMGQTISRFTTRDGRGNILDSTIALGESQNVTHFRDILSALFLQSGNPIVTQDRETGMSRVTLMEGVVSATSASPTARVLEFYTSFANPTSAAYSWNRSLPSSLNMFIAGRSAFYIGRASELFTIQSQNPNLNFDVTELFQADDAPRPTTYGSFTAASVLKNSANFNAGYAFVGYLASVPSAVDELSKIFSLPPTRRDLLLVPQPNPYVSVFFRAALSAFSWPDGNYLRTIDAFRAMIQNVNSGRSDPDTAINEAIRSLQSYTR